MNEGTISSKLLDLHKQHIEKYDNRNKLCNFYFDPIYAAELHSLLLSMLVPDKHKLPMMQLHGVITKSHKEVNMNGDEITVVDKLDLHAVSFMLDHTSPFPKTFAINVPDAIDILNKELNNDNIRGTARYGVVEALKLLGYDHFKQRRIK